MKKKILIALGAVIGVVALLVVGALVLIDPEQLVNEKKDELLKDVSAKIGREVTAGKVSASLGSQLKARVEQVQVAGLPGKQPALYIGAVDVRFSLARALLSFGRDLHVDRFRVQGLQLRAARDADARWDFQDILDKLASDESAPQQKGESTALAGARIAELSIEDGVLELDDKVLGRPLQAYDVDLQTSDVVLGDPLMVSLHAILRDGTQESPIDVKTRLALLPKDLSFDPLPDVELDARLMDVDLGAWGALLPADVPAPVRGTLRAIVKATLKDDAARIAVDGTLNARELVLRDALSPMATAAERASAPRGRPLSADVELSLELDDKAERTEVKKLTLKGSGLDLAASLSAKGSSLAGLEKADVKASAQDLAALLQALPPSLRGLPDEARIEGPLQAHLSAAGESLELSVNLDAARVRYLDVPEGKTAAEATAALFDKAAGLPLHVSLHGLKKSRALEVDKLELVVDTAKIAGTLSLPTEKGEPLVADVASGPVQLVSLKSLAPPFAEALGKGQRVDGTVELKVKASSDGGKQMADAALDMRALDVNLAATTVRGAGSVTVKAQPQGGDVDLSVVANLDGLSVTKRAEDGSTTLSKPAGLPLRLDAVAKKTKERADFSKLVLAIGRSTLNGRGSIADLDKEVARLDIDLGQVQLGFDDLRQTLPGAARLPAGGRLSGAIKLAGGTSTDTLAVDAKGLNVVFGSSRLAGDLNVKNLSDPVLDVKLAQVDLAFDDVRGLSASTADLPAGGRFKGSLTLQGDTKKSSSVKAGLKIESLTAADSNLKGQIDIENLDKPRFDLSLSADKLNVDKLREAFSSDTDEKTKKKKDGNPHGLSKETRALLADVNGRGKLTAARAIVKGIPVTDFKGDLSMTRGKLRFDTLEFHLYGGTMTATGSAIDLPAEKTGYDLKLAGKDIDFGAAMAEQTGLGRIFSGTVSPKLEVKGRGLAAGDFALSAEGPAEMKFKSLSISTLDVLGPIGEAVNKTGKLPGMKLGAASAEKGLSLQAFTALTKFIGGRLKLEKPIDADTPLGKMEITGASGLDAGMDFTSTLHLTPSTVAKLTGNKIKVKEAVPVPLKITGSWDKPKVSGVDVGKLVTALVAAAGKDALSGAVDDLLGGDDDKKGDKKGKKKDKKKDKKSTEEKAMDAAKNLLGK